MPPFPGFAYLREVEVIKSPTMDMDTSELVWRAWLSFSRKEGRKRRVVHTGCRLTQFFLVHLQRDYV